MRVGLVDGMFAGSLSASLAQENAGQQSELLQWDRKLNITNDIIVFTDTSFSRFDEFRHLPDKKVFWIIEPRELSALSYNTTYWLDNGVDLILTHEKSLVTTHPNIEYISLGGSWLKDWWLNQKTLLVSSFISEKMSTSGHRLRHEVARQFNGIVDIYGKPYTGYLPTKSLGLKSYAFSIVIENSKVKGWYTEKLIDCFSQGTVPILWGHLPDGFNPDGVLIWHSLNDLRTIINHKISFDWYESKRDAIAHNLQEAKKHKRVEDRIFDVFKNRGWI